MQRKVSSIENPGGMRTRHLPSHAPVNLATLAAIVFGVLYVLAPATVQAAQVSGELKQWHAVTIIFDGPQTSETATPNPFTDYRLDVTFTGPSGQTYKVPGYYAADGNAGNSGASSGNKWVVKFCPDAAGSWTYQASFVQGAGVAAQLTGGTSAGYFDGDSASFAVATTDKPANGIDLRGKGKLEYVDQHYLRFRSGDYFIRSGSNIPETFLEYNDFDGTQPNLDYSAHVADWHAGDPSWMSGKGKGIIGALNYLSGLGVNSMYFLTMNNYGDGRKAWPWTGADNYYNYDCSKLEQWDVVFSHMDKMGMMLHVVLTETENEVYFEVKQLGTSSGFASSRKVYYREMVARFGYHLGITWNLGEESGWNESGGYATGSTTTQRKDWADYIRQLTYYKDNISVHNGPSWDDSIYAPLLGHPSLTGAEIQWDQGAEVHQKVLEWRTRSHANGHRWVVTLDEPYTGTTLLNDFRIYDVWGSYMAGAGGCELFVNGDGQIDDFHPYESLYRTVALARKFFQDNIPYTSMEPADGLVSGASGYGLAKIGETYLVYLRAGGAASLNLTGVTGVFDVRWFDPRNGGSLQTGSVASIAGGAVKSLGFPPNNTGLDWTALVRINGNHPPVVSGTALPTSGVPPLSVNFSSAGTSDPDGDVLSYSWDFGDGTSSSAPNPVHDYQIAGLYVATLQVSDGKDTSSVTLTITVGNKPTGVILSPAENSKFRAGERIYIVGDATDPDEALSNSAFSWMVMFHRDGNAIPAYGPVTGVRSLSFDIPSNGLDFSGLTRYQVLLTVTDSNGLSHSSSVFILPDKVNVTVDSVPSGLVLQLDGISTQTPFIHDSLKGFQHTLSAPDQLLSGRQYQFMAWNDGGQRSHSIVVPDQNTSYIASYLLSAVTAFPNTAVVLNGTQSSGTAASLVSDDNVYFAVNSTTSGTRTAAWYGSFTGVERALTSLRVNYRGNNSRSCTQTVAIWNWRTARWEQLDSRTVGTTEVAINNLTPTGTLVDYVSGTAVTGEVRARIQCQANQSLTSRGDLMSIVFTLTTVPNTPPTISALPSQTIGEDTGTGALPVTVGDAETVVGGLTLSGGTSNATLVPVGNIVFGGSGANRTVTVTPAANQTGTATITVTVSDGQATAVTNFLLTVTPVNDVPTISSLANQTTTVGTALGPLAVTVGDIETSAGSLTLSGGTSNVTLVPVGNIIFGGSGANRTVTVTPAASQTGTATITVTVSDEQATAATSFLLTVNAVTTPPTVASLSPNSGTTGNTNVTITGTNFGVTQGTSTVTFNGTPATPTSWSATSLVVPVPAGATTGNVVVTVGGQASNGVIFTVKPAITLLVPASGPVGTAVTITGTTFGATQGTSTVTFNGTAATPTSWSATSLVVPVPAGATTGNVVVTVGGQASNGFAFTVTAASTQPTFVQVNQNRITSGTTNSVAFSALNRVGDLIVAYVAWTGQAGVSVTDSRGNTYASAAGPTAWVDGRRAQVFYAKNVAAGANTVTTTFSSSVSTFGLLYVAEYSGVGTVSPLETVSISSGSGSISGTVTTVAANDLIVAVAASNSTITSTSAGFVARSTAYGNMVEDRPATLPGNYAVGMSQNGSGWVLQVLVFRAAQ